MHQNRRRDPPRRGGALLVALALLMLGAALLAGSIEAGRSATRSAQSHEAAVIADAESRVSVAEYVTQWSAANDSLPVGGARLVTIGPRRRGTNAVMVVTRVRVQRISRARFVVAADCQVGPDDAVQARRRLQIVLERPTRADSITPLLPPEPIRRWGMTDIY